MTDLARRPFALVLLLASLVTGGLALTACGGGGAEEAPTAAATADGSGLAEVVSAEEAHAAFDAGSAIMIDVREPEELAERRVPGTIDIPLGELESRLGEVPTGQPVLVLCRSGNRAQPAAETLRAAGYEASVVDGGIIAWDAAGLPYEGAQPG